VDNLQKTLTSNLIYNITEYLKKNNLIEPNTTLIVGLSGGPDSVFLLHFFAQLQQSYSLNLIAAHLNHEWREDAHKDVIFCKKLAQLYNVTFISETVSSLPPVRSTSSQEERGRLLRRAFFEQLYKQYTAHSIALAHHQDDQIETFFIRLARGAGLQGLTGMKPREGKYIRPLLPVTKQQIISFLDNHDIPYLTDPTNTSMAFLRNRIRHTLLPTLTECDKRYPHSIIRTMSHLEEANNFMQDHIQKLFAQHTEKNTSGHWLHISAVLQLHPFVKKQLILHWLITEGILFTPSAGLFNEIIRFLKNKKSHEHTLYNSWKITKKKDFALLTCLS